MFAAACELYTDLISAKACFDPAGEEDSKERGEEDKAEEGGAHKQQQTVVRGGGVVVRLLQGGMCLGAMQRLLETAYCLTDQKTFKQKV